MWPWSTNKTKTDNLKVNTLPKSLHNQSANAARQSDGRPIAKNKTSVEIIRETKNMLANGKFSIRISIKN